MGNTPDKVGETPIEFLVEDSIIEVDGGFVFSFPCEDLQEGALLEFDVVKGQETRLGIVGRPVSIYSTE